MKLNKLALTLIAASLIPTFAYADTDTVAASFERDLNREPVTTTVMVAGNADPLADIFNAALYGKTDQVLASFERDMYHEPVNSAATTIGEVDSLVKLFNVALQIDANKPVRQVGITGKHHGS